MANIGAEVGQKMRSAIKAKLLELNCYVDDELPDYVMVMVANKRTKSQMKEDLQLFLSNKTTSFVDWLHIVLKKLKEVTVTNPDLLKKTAKRKSDDASTVNIKKEKKEKKKTKKEEKFEGVPIKCLTDDLPINANKLAEQRKIVVMKENQSNNSEQVSQDSFDIPLLSEVNLSTEEELEDLERKIKSVKNRLGLLVDSDDEDEECLNIKAEPDELFGDGKKKAAGLTRKVAEVVEEKAKTPSEPQAEKVDSRRSEKTKITFNSDELEKTTTAPKKRSVLERLGKRRLDEAQDDSLPTKKSRSEENAGKRTSAWSAEGSRKNKSKESVLSRLGVMSKVSIPERPPKPTEEPEVPFKGREVPSVVKIKPRIIPHDAPQANKNLLLKAVAEAQRSIAQTPTVGAGTKPDALFTRKYKEKRGDERTKATNKKSLRSLNDKNDISKAAVDKLDNNNSNTSSNLEYVPESIIKQQDTPPKYVPSPKLVSSNKIKSSENGKVRQQFIVTLDGIEKTKFKDLTIDPSNSNSNSNNNNNNNNDNDNISNSKPSIKSRLDRKKSPSPIIFDKSPSSPVKAKVSIPDKLPVIHAPASIKNKERCKYWPSCRQGEKCEFVHPSTNCDMFPHCKFGDKCLFLHPNCKFGSSCTRRDCNYTHSPAGATLAASKQICKYFPNCTNLSCNFLHPKPCKFGKFCKNQQDCTFSHGFLPGKSSLTWRPK